MNGAAVPVATGGPREPLLRWNAVNVSLAALLAAAVLSRDVLSGGDRDLEVGRSLLRFLGGFLPPDLSVLRDTAGALVETLQIAVWATLLSSLLSLPFAAAGAPRLSPRGFASVSRLFLGAVRTIPSLVWALLAVAVLGPTPLAGVAALTFYSLGYLGKFAGDDAGSLDVSRASLLRTSGASRFQSFLYGVWPEVKPLATSRVLWMLEYNVRSAAIIGYVGAGGIGSRLHEYQEFGQWDRFATVLLVLFAVVMLLDLWGGKLRGALSGNAPPAGE